MSIDKTYETSIPEVKIKVPIKEISPASVIEKDDNKKFDWRNDAFLKPNAESTNKIIDKFRDVRNQRKSGLIDVLRYVKENLERNRVNEKILAPFAANLELFIEQNYARYRGNEKSINLLNIALEQEDIDISLVPLNKGGKVGGAQIIDSDGNKHLFMPIQLSRLNQKYRRELVASIRQQAKESGRNAVKDVNLFPQHEEWIHAIEDSNNSNILWLPINPDKPGQILTNEHTLQTYLKVECFKDIREENAIELAAKYSNLNDIWSNEKSSDNEKDSLLLETNLYTDPGDNVELRLSSQLSHDILLETGYLEIDKKKLENQDCAYVGKNKAGNMAIAVFDGVSASTRGHVLSRIMAAHVGISSGKDKKSLLTALQIGFRAAQDQLDFIDGKAAATGTAGLIDKDNKLHLFHKGDTRAYLIRNGELKLLTPIQNEKTTKIRDLMKANPDMTKSEAKKIVELDDPNLRNTPNVYNIDEKMDEGGVFQLTEQLQPGDQLIFSSDGAFDNMQTLEAEERYILAASKQKNPATYLGNAANSLRRQQGKKGRDDLGIAYMRVK